MSNFLAIATVTATLRRILEREISSEVPGVAITTQPPDTVSTPSSDGLNVFLYQVTWNSGYSNFDVPSRGVGGTLVGPPLVGLNLHYLLTAYGAGNDDLQAHRILASAIRILHENPLLTREAINTTKIEEPGFADSDLADQMESVKLNHQPLPIEEMTKLWSSFFQTRYRVSIAYQATVVVLDSEKKPRPALPVTARRIYLQPFKRPLIEMIEPQTLERTNDAEIMIRGRNLSSDHVVVQFGDIQTTVETERITDNHISTTIPESLTAGIIPVQVIHMMKLGSSPEPYQTFKSNVAAFVLVPRIVNILTPVIAVGSELVIEVEPSVSPGQKVEFYLGDYVISMQPLSGNQPTNQLSIRLPSDILEQGQQEAVYLLRVRVDGAESFLQVDNQNRFVGPTIKVTAT